MAEKPKMALMNPQAAEEVAKGAPALVQPAPSVRPVTPDKVHRQSKQASKEPSSTDRLYVYLPPALAKATRVYCAGEKGLTLSEFAEAALRAELKRRGVSVKI